MQIHNFDIYRGDDSMYTLSFSFDDGSPAQLTGTRLVMDIVRNKKVVTTLSTDAGNGVRIISPNEVLVTFSHALTKDWGWTKAVYDLQVERDGFVRTVLRGGINLTHDITR